MPSLALKEPALPSVLLVDDDPDLRAVLKRILRLECSLDTREAADGMRALTLLEQRRFAVAVVDLDLGPGPDGLHVLATCRERWPEMRRVLYSGSADSDHVRSGLADRVVHKAQDPHAIAAAICELAKGPRP